MSISRSIKLLLAIGIAHIRDCSYFYTMADMKMDLGLEHIHKEKLFSDESTRSNTYTHFQ